MSFLKIPLAKPDTDEAEIRAAAAVIASGWLTQGPRAIEFETELSRYLGAQQTYCVSSCTTGLLLALKSAGIGAGDEVIVPSFSFIATANSVVHAGAVPVFADIDPATYNLDIESVRAAIGPKTRAVLLVHQVGMPADIDVFGDLCRQKNLILIEDAACAIGSKYKGVLIGRHSDWVVFSFHPRKILTTGEGGAICYNGSSEKVKQYLNIARKHGMDVNDLERHASTTPILESYPVIGYNFRLTDIQASIGLEQLKKLPTLIKRRRELAQRYNQAFAECSAFQVPFQPGYAESNFQSYLLRLTPQSKIKTLDLMRELGLRGIASRRGVMCSHLQPCYDYLKSAQRVPLKHSERAVEESIVIPIYSSMTDEEQNYTIENLMSLGS